MAQLRILASYKGKHTTFDLNADQITLGRPNPIRKIDVDLSPDMRASRLQAEMYYQDGIWWIRDLESHNGTERSRSNMTVVKVSPHQAVEVLPGDELLVGDTTLEVQFATEALDPVAVQPAMEAFDEASAVSVDEFMPPPQVSEDTALRIMVNLLEITNHAFGETMLDQCLVEIEKTFGSKANHYCILLRKDHELLPFASLPRGRTRARFSYTLARLSIQREQAFRWPDEQALRSVDGRSEIVVTTHEGIVESMYAPILAGGAISGVIHVGSDKPDVRFTSRDIQLLTLMATTMAPAVQRDWFIGQFKPDHYPLVFISYSHKDTKFVRQIADQLRKRFIRVWIDERIETGDDWRESIAKAIRNADAFVLIMSPTSVESKYVRQEISAALHFEKPIIPVMHRTAAMPDVIAHLQYQKLGKPGVADYEVQMGLLVELIKKTVGR